MKLHKPIFFLLLFGLVLAGCKKYALAPLVQDPAYIRVFNNLTSTIDALHNQQATPFLTFLMDPKTDASGVPSDAGIIGDYLGTRQLFSLSYPINEANSSTGNGTLGNFTHPATVNLTPVNYEYPGNAHVQVAPVINGLDLSAWAQVPSGRHRIMFVVRPQSNPGFKDLSETQRSSILVDTTVNFEKGEVYTLEVVSRDLDNNKYGVYIRQEQFTHQAFDPGKLYVGFINLSGKATSDMLHGLKKYMGDKINITGTYNIFNDAASAGGGQNGPGANYDPYPGYNNTVLTTLTTKMDATIDYQPLPFLSQDAFFYQGLPRIYADITGHVFVNPLGTLPYFNFQLFNADDPMLDPFSSQGFFINCGEDPSIFNSYVTSNSTPQLNLMVNTGKGFHVYSTLNIMEIVYDRVYLMQIQRGFNEVPNN